MPLAPEWQHPFVNVFKICDVDTMKEIEMKGDVTEHMDKIIGKKVFKVRGMIPAGNFLRVPRSRLQTLGLTGRVLYIQLKVTPIKVFVIHIEVLTEDQNVHRISISNMYSPDALKRKSNGVQLAFPRASHRWCVLAVDLRDALRGFTSSPFASIKSIQMCSWLTVRTMFTSDYRFSLESLPSDMALSHALDTGMFEMVWLPQEPLDAPTMDFMPPPKRFTGRRRKSDVPTKAAGSSPAAGKAGSAGKAPSSAREAWGSVRASSAGGAGTGASGSSADAPDDYDNDQFSSDGEKGTPRPPSPVRPPLSPDAAAAAVRRATAASLAAATAATTVVGAAAVPRRPGDPEGGGFPRRAPAINHSGTPGATATTPPPRRPVTATGRLGVDAALPGSSLLPDPALNLLRMNAYSGEFIRCLVWLPGGDEVAFAAASVVVLMRVSDVPTASAGSPAPPAARLQQPQQQPGRQRHLLGHTAFVCALAASSNGELVMSAQEGKEAVVRLWDVASGACVAILNAHASGLSCVDISPDVRAVAAVGLDAHARQTIALWNISEMRNPHRKIELVTRHATEYNIKVLRFSAYQEDHLLTAGRDSIRIYRLKAGQLRGTSVRLVPQNKRVTSHAGGVSAALGPNIFTDIAFEAGVGVYGADAFKVYVSSASGAVFQVDYTTRQLESIYQLHAAAINCLVVADGLALTAGDDRLLRAWPLDFKDYLLEAEHESSVTGLALSPDALRVAIGTENGTLGCLHIPDHSYVTQLRSHSAAVNAVAMDPNREHFVTVSTDGTLRIWHLLTFQQLFEFDAPGEAVTCVAYHPLPSNHELAAGFANGRVRVFDVGTTTLIQEQQQHRAAVAELVFTPGGDRLFSGGMDGALVMYDVQRLYAPAQYLSAGMRDIRVCVAVSSDGAYIASLIRDPYRSVTSLLVFYGKSMEPFMRIETDAEAYVKLAFSPDSKELWALASCRRLDRYELTDGHLVQQILDVSPLEVTTLAMDPLGRYVLTAGVDGLLRLWARLPTAALQPCSLPPHQAFVGHPSSVLGAAFHRGHLITVGDADSICIWRVTADAQQQSQHAQMELAARAAAALRQAALPPALTASAPYASPAAAAAHAAALADPHHPLSRASPWTALGPVADAADHQLTTRAAALGGIALPPGTILVPAPAVAAASPRNAGPQPSAAATAFVPPSSSPRAMAAFDAAAAALASVRIDSPRGGASAATGPQPPVLTPRPVHLTSGSQRDGAIGGSPRTQSHSHSPRAPAAAPLPGTQRSPTAAVASPPQPTRLTPPLAAQQQQQSRLRTPALARPQTPPPPQQPQLPQPPPKCSWLLGYTPTGCANVAWRSETGVFAYVVEDMVVLEHLATRRQRYLRGHSQPLACLAVSHDGTRVAAAPLAPELYEVEPSAADAVLALPCTTAPFADLVVWDVASGAERWRLRYHTQAVQALSFSPDGRWLLSLGREPERSVVLWDVAAGQLVAAGRTERLPVAAEWLWGGDHPAFASVGPEGLLLWTLQDSFLEQRSVPLSDMDAPVPCTALAVDPAGALLVAEAPLGAGVGGGGASADPLPIPIWHVEVAGAIAGGAATIAQVARMPGDAAVTAMAAGCNHALIATDQGHVVRFRRTTLSGTWTEDTAVRLDGRVVSLSAEPGMADVVAATATSTIWFVGMQDASSVPIVCGQPAPVQALLPAPHDPRVMASTSQDGLLRVWRLGPEDAEPVIELRSSSACTAAAFLMRAPDGPPPDTEWEEGDGPGASTPPAEPQPPQPMLLGGYSDGSLRLFALEPAVGLQWALARHPAPLVGVVPHPYKSLVLTASSDGSLAITDLRTTRLVSYVTTFTALGPAGSGSPSASGRRSPASPHLANARPGTGPMQAFAVSPGVGASVAAAGWRDRFVVFSSPWDDPTCAPISVYECQPAAAALRSGEELVRQPPEVPALLSFVGGATKLLTYCTPLMPGVVVVFDYRLGVVVRRVTIPQVIRSLALSPDGSALVIGSTERTVFLVNLSSGNFEGLMGHTGPVVAAAFSADGSYAVTAAGSVLMVWDATETLRRLVPLPPPPPRRTLFEV
ncbi:hypothetical protein PLESTB_000825300 [Pleodorina starrii]|uniref:CFA20 domain-containing protein n=1 Tax=Pleodorina starrii TaxID=330485 RepID=A0A9W6BLT4_9CHLO|nr:hypothetical protein PLESTM_000140700 [Pleodorina starrii]GLC54115.1 hypothetical protein PLESTB_000825300 [Pleodorina starrii]GLC64582.1 hypothetical protein PLESTF_000181300 [Pleodorina starrii]